MQANSSVLLLFIFLIVAFGATIVLMHETKIPDEYAKWAQGFTEGILTGLTLAMRPPGATNSHQDHPPDPPKA